MGQKMAKMSVPIYIYIYIYPITLNGYIYSPGKKNRKNQKKIEKIKKIEKNKKCSEQFLGPLPGP